ncbi:YbaN family protein [Bowmanella yangjiangensis]|uniref:Inner membrane protein n=1 Tax=Bowmanella yangjiangensis TaxID=2811230 RepID=A0ABS3CYD7_9ALTE|nr:YbaN family protein [Bowmanella yangjiangensis]
MRGTIRLFWRVIALCLVGVGLVGVILPGLPTVVFLLMAAWCASKGWPELEVWLLNHPSYGLTIRNWREFGSVPRKAKVLASVMISFSCLLLWLSSLSYYIKLSLSIVLGFVILWLWYRPELSLDN